MPLIFDIVYVSLSSKVGTKTLLVLGLQLIFRDTRNSFCSSLPIWESKSLPEANLHSHELRVCDWCSPHQIWPISKSDDDLFCCC